LNIDLSDIAATPGARGRYSVSEHLAPVEGLSCVGPVTGEITVENTGSLLLVRGRIGAVLKLSCTRCLCDFERPLALDIEEEFAAEGAGPDIRTVDREEPEASAISDYVLDVSELVRQQVLLNVPLAAVCRPDCSGICPKCGQDLNQGPCNCTPETADSRWTELRDLLSDAPITEE
jgi:uncharacterized protein